MLNKLIKPIFLRPIFKERIWGGTALKDVFNYKIPSENTGECWAISSHPNGQSVADSGDFKDKTLSELWDKHPHLFGGYKSDRFPLLIKILDANDDLSVQVHPNDLYAKQNENGEWGKTECWFILDCNENAEIIIGHNAVSTEQFLTMIQNNQWSKLLKRIKIKPGDFFYIPSGTLHALCKGTIVLEIQQSSDTTYRVYDYDRRDHDGNLRELHLDKAMDVMTIPHRIEEVQSTIINTESAAMTRLMEGDYFTVYKWDVYSFLERIQDKHFLLVSVIDGYGVMKVNEERYSLQKGQHFILPYGLGAFTIEGVVKMIVCHP